MIIHREDAKGEAEPLRMFSEHPRRRTGATDFVAPWAATGKTFALFVLYRDVRMSRAQGCAGATTFAVRDSFFWNLAELP